MTSRLLDYTTGVELTRFFLVFFSYLEIHNRLPLAGILKCPFRPKNPPHFLLMHDFFIANSVYSKSYVLSLCHRIIMMINYSLFLHWKPGVTSKDCLNKDDLLWFCLTEKKICNRWFTVHRTDKWWWDQPYKHRAPPSKIQYVFKSGCYVTGCNMFLGGMQL